MKWYNEPPVWNVQENIISVTSGLNTDFWRKTHYGFIRDTGHFYYQEITHNFIAEVKIIGQYQVLYDQAGLMIRENDQTWLKCGIEFVDSIQYASTVVTRDYSDWSVVALPQNLTSLWLKLQRTGGTVEVQYSLDGEQFKMMRLAYLTETQTVQVGLMCASLEREGFEVSFENFQVKTL